MWERVRARSGAGNSPAVIRKQTAIHINYGIIRDRIKQRCGELTRNIQSMYGANLR